MEAQPERRLHLQPGPEAGGTHRIVEGNNYRDLLDGFHRIHPDTVFGKNVRIGYGTVIEVGCEFGDNVLIGHNVMLRPNTFVGADSVISHGSVCEGNCVVGQRVSIHGLSILTMGLIIEDDVFIGGHLSTSNTKRIAYRRPYGCVCNAPYIKRAARIGSAVRILPGVVIGENALIGNGSIVTKNIPDGQIWMGCPARYLKDVPQDEIL